MLRLVVLHEKLRFYNNKIILVFKIRLYLFTLVALFKIHFRSLFFLTSKKEDNAVRPRQHLNIFYNRFVQERRF